MAGDQRLCPLAWAIIMLGASVTVVVAQEGIAASRASSSPAATAAEDKAEGFGAPSKGGEGSKVITVTSLADSGKGTLREALGQSGPRIIRFGVEGTIQLKSRLRCTTGRVTIDGATAPGDGITLQDHGFQFVNCSDIIVRHLRIRVTTGDTSGDGILLWGKDGQKMQRALVDHCSIMGATDEVVNTWGQVEDVTFQWCIIAEGRRPHSKAWLSGEGSDGITIHHCLLANCDDRNPKLEGGRYDFTNNVIYGWVNNNATKVRAGARVNIVNNTYLAGPNSAPQKGCVFIEDPPKGLKLFVFGNISPLTSKGENPWSIVTLNEEVAGKLTERRPAPTIYQAEKPFEVPPVTIQTAGKACNTVLDRAGARVRDEADTRVVEQVRQAVVTTVPQSALPR